MTVRMIDIAQKLGLSVVTISKVLHNHPDISEETRKRVLNYIKKVDYQPNILARSLVTGRSFLVGLVVPDLLHPFFAEIAKSLSQTIGAMGYLLSIASSEEDPGLEAREIRQLQARRLDALVIASCATTSAHIAKLVLEDARFVLIDRKFPKLEANFIGTDDVLAGRIATEHLIQKGCRRIAHIRGRENSVGQGRFKGYKAALRAHGLRYRSDYVISRPSVDADSIEQGKLAVGELFKRAVRPDGIFCYNDPLAIGAMESILNEGLRVPDDIAIIGCGNLHYDASLRVSLSSIDQQSKLIGKYSGELILKMVKEKETIRPQTTILEPKVVERSSTNRHGSG